MKKQIWQFKKGSLLALLVVLSLVLAAVPVFGRQNTVATLDPVQGLVQYQAAGAAEDDWHTLTRVQIVSEGDRIRTDHLGLAYLTFFEGNQIEILPNSLVQVSRFDFVDPNSPEISLEMSIGDMRSQIEQVLDADSRYEIQTPSAVIVVRGTDFWATATWLSESYINVLQGRLEVAGVAADGQLSVPVAVEQNQSVQVFPLGQVGPAQVLDPAQLPQYPPQAPLAPETCGNLICEAGENEANCSIDCRILPTCPNGICELDAGEGPVTCPADCVPEFRRQSEVTIVPAPPPAEPPPPTPCTVQTSQPYVNVHVGPGTNRGVRYDLPRNRPITVVGKSTDSTGGLWWQIQPPGYNPAEADRYWVAANDVEETGDCDLVPDVGASPIIAPPPPQPSEPIPPASEPIPSVPEPILPAVSISFVASQYSIVPGDCVTIRWDVEGIREVYYQNLGVVGHDSRVECPSVTTTYTLRVILVDGSVAYRTITISISSVPDY